MNRDLHVQALLPAWLDDRLGPAEHARVQAHLETCAECARAADAYRALGRLLDDDESPAPLHPMWPAIARRRDPVRRRIADFGFALASAAALSAGFMLGVLALGDGARSTPATVATTAAASVDTDLLSASERTLSDVYFFDTASNTETSQ